MKVLYIAGSGRSGSTIVSNMLARLGGWVSLGEIRLLWERGLELNWWCGCGKPVRTCPFWWAVLKEAFGSPDQLDLAALLEADRSLHRVRHIPQRLAEARYERRSGLTSARRYYEDALGRIYGAIARVSGAPVIVDSSKMASYGLSLMRIPSIDLSVLHLVRDPRAVAYSWSTVRPRPDAGVGRDTMLQFPYWQSALLWSAWNLAAEIAFHRAEYPYLRLRLEDIVADPRRTFREIFELLGAPTEPLDFFEGAVELGVHHTVSGNVNRLERGRTRLGEDERWRTRMGPPAALLVTALTAHSSLRYGYPLRPGLESGSDAA